MQTRMTSLLGCAVFLLSIICLPNPLNAQQFIGSKKLYYGAAYYPEAWDSSQIDRDIRYMKDLKMNVMRIGEFAWSTMEPKEGQYNFKWLHRVIEKLKANGIDVILGTPTATPPAWMLEKHPDMLLTTSSGERKVHGGRRDCNYASSLYIEKSRQICEAMSKEFGSKPGVIGWQTDNEFGLTFDYSPETEMQWHQWLAQEYGTIEALNKAWKTMLWSQTYDSFGQIPMPRYSKSDGEEAKVWHHPSLQVAWKKFSNLKIEEFQKMQEAALKKYSKLPVTHDSMPGQPVDYEKVMSSCDFMAVNCYHGYRGYEIVPSNYDRMRGMKKGFHWLFETTPNYSGGERTWYNHEPPGSERAFMWMNIALGGQGGMFWLWQQHSAGQEMVHGAVLSAWGKPFSNYSTLKQMGDEFDKTSDFLMNNSVSDAQVAIVYSHMAHYGLEVEPYVGGLKYYNDWSKRFYLPLLNTYLHRDVIYPSAELSSYKVLIVPMLPVASPAFRRKLKQWVEAGGTAIIGPMTGYRTENWSAFTDFATGDLESWSGIITETRNPISSIPVDPLLPIRLDIDGFTASDQAVAGLWTETYSSKGGKVLATYKDGTLAGKPAIIETRIGKGKLVVMGTDPGDKAMEFLYKKVAEDAKVAPLAQGQAGCLLVPRGQKGLVLLNFSNETKNLSSKLITGSIDLISGKKIESENVSLKAYEVLVLRRP